jgi:hypothetical protein
MLSLGLLTSKLSCFNSLYCIVGMFSTETLVVTVTGSYQASTMRLYLAKPLSFDVFLWYSDLYNSFICILISSYCLLKHLHYLVILLFRTPLLLRHSYSMCWYSMAHYSIHCFHYVNAVGSRHLICRGLPCIHASMDDWMNRCIHSWQGVSTSSLKSVLPVVIHPIGIA